MQAPLIGFIPGGISALVALVAAIASQLLGRMRRFVGLMGGDDSWRAARG